MATKNESARIVRVFVSSPSDVAKERQQVDRVVRRINQTDGQRLKMRLEEFRWERDVTRQIGPGPQPVIDTQTPPYDIYLGIMAYRFGTPTEAHGSGTQKEFEDALSAWGRHQKPWILFLFNEKAPGRDGAGRS